MALAQRVTIRSGIASDVDAVVGVHLDAFPDHFLTALGGSFLKVLYESLHAEPDGVFIVAESHGSIVGVAAGVQKQGVFYRRILRTRIIRFAVAGLRGSIAHPSRVARLVRALGRPHDVQQSAAEACLMSLAVLPETRDRGVGAALVDSFCRALAERGAPAVCLTTDRDGNDGVNQFYQKLGFHVARQYVTPEGRAMNEYVMDLTDYVADDDAR